MLYRNKNILVVNSDEMNQKSRKYIRYETDTRLLKRLLMVPEFSHCNYAEIGSHSKSYRKLNTFERSIYDAIVNFHC